MSPGARTAARRRGIVIGAGLSGLACAHRWLALEPSIDLQVLEAADRAGGLLGTEERDGFVIELGPDAILSEKPAAKELVRALGIEDRVVSTRPEHRGAYVVAAGRLARVPEGFSMMAPVDPIAFLREDVISLGARVRAGAEIAVPRRRGKGDESLARFVRRRFGAEVLERLAQPLVSGIYGSDAEQLSLEATMPRFPAMERERGSVVRALRGARDREGSQKASGARYGLFFSFDRGMQVLIDALVAAIGAQRISLGVGAIRIERDRDGWRVILGDGSSERADAIAIALSSWRASALLRDVPGVPHDALDAIPHGSAATVTFGWRSHEIPRPLDAYGFVVPAVERRSILASTWASSKWPGRAAEGSALIRVFVGGVHDEDAAERDDRDLVATARRELRALMGIEASPLFSRVVRYRRAMPIYRIGHLDRASAIEAKLAAIPTLALAGNSLRGVGIPDAIASGERAAEALARS